MAIGAVLTLSTALAQVQSPDAAQPASLKALTHQSAWLQRGAVPEGDCILFDPQCGIKAQPGSTLGPSRFRTALPEADDDAILLPRDGDLTDLLKAPRDIPPTIDAEALIAKFEAQASSLELVREGKAPVPRIFLARLPRDLPELRSTSQRKAAFIKTVLPLILHANQEVAAKRRRILAIQQVRRLGLDEGAAARRFLAATAEEYETAAGDLQTLLRRVDIVPPSQALAQAAEESGWGTSRFARRGNAVFGQRTFKSGRGMVPRERAEGETHEVLAFNSLQTSVSAYVWNLNTHFAYAEFRKLRARQRREAGVLDSKALVGTLLRYSERGPAYVETIRTIMRVNKLSQFDDARLAGGDQLAESRPTIPRFAY